MRITTKGRYALRAVLNLASTDQSKPVSIKQIAQEEKISPEFLEQIFFRLKKAGLIRSVRGPGGGFLLDKPRADISVKAIFEAVGEGLDLTPCTSCDTEPCERIDDCFTRDVWKEVSDRINTYFEELSLQEILTKREVRLLDLVKIGEK